MILYFFAFFYGIMLLYRKDGSMKVKRKYMNRSNWKRLIKSRFFKKNSIFFDKNCVVGLLILDEVTEPLVLDNNLGKYTVAANGYKWLQIAVENENYWITVMFDDSNHLVQIYCDVTDGNVLGDNPYFDDLFIDIVLYNNNVFMIDQDDLINAYREGVITTLQYNKAKVASLRLYDFVSDNRNEIIDYCYRMLNELSEE